MIPEDGELMTVGEARAYLGVSKFRFAGYVDKGWLEIRIKPFGDQRLRWVSKRAVQDIHRRLNESKKLAPAA